MTILKMTLKINKKASTIIWRILLFIVLALGVFFFVKVALFENAYYSEKEGSERAVASEQTEEAEELIEVAPTEEEVKEYTVDADKPRYLTIEKLSIYNARILEVGVGSDDALGTPNNIFDVGWYTKSSKPGAGGTLLIDGHNGGPHVRGVFKDLPSLATGDEIVIERGDGVKFVYEVVENVEVSLEDANAYMSTAMKTPVAGKESVTLISCTGEWSDVQETYLSRQFTRAILAE